MRIVIQAQPDASGAMPKPYLFEIASGGIESPANLQINGSRNSQVFEGLRAASVLAQDRGNVKTTITFDITRLQDNISDAQNFMLLHQSTIPGSGKVIFYMEDGTRLYMYNSVVETVRSHHTGTTTFHSYSIVGGGITSV